ncbi:hypothetical protein LCGC14_1398460 [marine sediment metagenome]|uniref:Uncharacterized protein n=1 Tax=marine sediment metagenome TaxID=412755 RepID=A0A0F9MDC2_9ZZZZ|nr:hypothetical protein [Desulfobacterales bacterium]
MKKILAFMIVLAFLAIPAMAQEKPKPLTPQQRIENLIVQVLNWKVKAGSHTVTAARVELELIKITKQKDAIIKMLQEKLKAANAKVARLEKKSEAVVDTGL